MDEKINEGRRTAVATLAASFAVTGCALTQKAEVPNVNPVMRISRAKFEAKDFEKFRAMLIESQARLEPALRKLPGLIRFYAGIDAETNTMINASEWQSLAEAKALDTLPEMLTEAKSFIAAGITFERPQTNFIGLWNF
jgi:hypothetical protein